MENEKRTRVSVFKFLGKIPKDYKVKKFDWGVKLLFSIGKYNLFVNIPKKARINNYGNLKIVYEILVLIGNDRNGRFGLVRTFLTRRPDLILPLNKRSYEVVSAFINRILSLRPGTDIFKSVMLER